MSATLEELWYGNIVPFEDACTDNAERKELLALAVRNQNELSATLSEKQKEILEKYNECLTEMSAVCQKETFIYGFRLGARISLEILCDDFSAQ